MNQKPRSMPTRSFAMSVKSGARQSWKDGSQKRSAAALRVAGRPTNSTATSNVYRNERTQIMPGLPRGSLQGVGPVETQTKCPGKASANGSKLPLGDRRGHTKGKGKR